MRLAVVVRTIGVFLRYFAATFAAPVVVALWYREWTDLAAFVGAGLFTAVGGHLLVRIRRQAEECGEDGEKRC